MKIAYFCLSLEVVREVVCSPLCFAAAVLSVLPGKKDLTEKVCSRGRQALADRPPLKILMTILYL